jgi:hypothetical protein
MMQLDSTLVLLLGALFAVTALLVIGLGIGFGVAAWGWSWASRFESMSAGRDADTGAVMLSAKLKSKEPKKARRLLPPSNGVRRMPVQRGQA